MSQAWSIKALSGQPADPKAGSGYRQQETGVQTAKVTGDVNYIGDMSERPRFYANDHSRDVLNLDPRTIRIENVRDTGNTPSLDKEGFTLVRHRSAVSDFRDQQEILRAHYPE